MRKNQISPIGVYTNEELGVVIRTSGTSEEPLFCLADLCNALELRVDNVSKRLLDAPYSIGVMDSLGREQKMKFIGEADMYRVIMRSDKDEALKFQEWVCKIVLPTIRKTGSFAMDTHGRPSTKKDDIKLKMEVASWAAKFLKLNDNSKLLLAHNIGAEVGLDKALPQYTPSKGILKPIGALLKSHNIGMSANAFNKILVDNGILETLERAASHGMKKFKHITEKGLKWGENQVSPHSPKETQPLWFEDKFIELLGHINIA